MIAYDMINLLTSLIIFSETKQNMIFYARNLIG